MDENPYQSPQFAAERKSGRHRRIDSTQRARRHTYRRIAGDAPVLLLILIVEIVLVCWIVGTP